LLEGESSRVGAIHFVVLACVKKVVNFFGGKKVHSRENPGYTYAVELIYLANCAKYNIQIEKQ